MVAAGLDCGFVGRLDVHWSAFEFVLILESFDLFELVLQLDLIDHGVVFGFDGDLCFDLIQVEFSGACRHRWSVERRVGVCSDGTGVVEFLEHVLHHLFGFLVFLL